MRTPWLLVYLDADVQEGASKGQVWARHLAPAAPASRPSLPSQFHMDMTYRRGGGDFVRGQRGGGNLAFQIVDEIFPAKIFCANWGTSYSLWGNVCPKVARPARYFSINYPDFSPRFTLPWRSLPSRPHCTAHLPYKARCKLKQDLCIQPLQLSFVV